MHVLVPQLARFVSTLDATSSPLCRRPSLTREVKNTLTKLSIKLADGCASRRGDSSIHSLGTSFNTDFGAWFAASFFVVFYYLRTSSIVGDFLLSQPSCYGVEPFRCTISMRCLRYLRTLEEHE
jgi:hypothetical protein